MTATHSYTLKSLLNLNSDTDMMNILQDRGLVSDLAVSAEDVADADAELAIERVSEEDSNQK